MQGEDMERDTTEILAANAVITRVGRFDTRSSMLILFYYPKLK